MHLENLVVILRLQQNEKKRGKVMHHGLLRLRGYNLKKKNYLRRLASRVVDRARIHMLSCF